MKKKTYEKIKKLGEEEYPIVKEGRKEYTPKEVYEEKKKLPLSLEPNWTLLEKRLKKKYEDGKLHTFHTFQGEVTPEKQLEEVKNRTSSGYTYMLMEQKYIEFLLEDE